MGLKNGIWRLSIVAICMAIIGFGGLSFADVIIDNGQGGTSSTGTWLRSSGKNPYGGGSLFAHTSATYTYQATGVTGSQEVFLWWTQYNKRCTYVPVDIYDGNTLIHTGYVDQMLNGGKWNSLGTHTFGGTARVIINSQGSCTTSADACKIAPTTSTPCPTLPLYGIMDNGSQ